jgi:hypothetical protein
LRLDATELLAKTRGARFTPDDLTADLCRSRTLQWTEGDRPQRRIVLLRTTVTPQHLGGVRRWWLCPSCRRRCRVLVAASPEAPVGCRVCLDARYLMDYPARDRLRRFVSLVHDLGRGKFDLGGEQELDRLLAPRCAAKTTRPPPCDRLR